VRDAQLNDLQPLGEENARRITELKSWFAELEDSGALVGLVRPRPWAAHSVGCLILDGPMAEELAERATSISSRARHSVSLAVSML